MFYKKSIDETLNQLKTSLDGLSSDTAKDLLTKHGYNELKEKDKTPTWKLFLETFKDPLVIILLIAALVQAFYRKFNNICSYNTKFCIISSSN